MPQTALSTGNRETRFPRLRLIMTKGEQPRMSEEKDNRARRYIRITDDDSWKLIDEISKIDKYKSSFNLIINDALFLGLPALYAKLYGSVEMNDSRVAELRGIYREHFSDEEFYAQVIRLLKELIVNVTVNKSMLSSLFNAKDLEYNGFAVPGKKFAQGAYSETPAYIEAYEVRGIINSRK